MSDLYKDSFYITKQEKQKMVKRAKEYGITTSECLRRIIDKHFEELEKYMTNTKND